MFMKIGVFNISILIRIMLNFILYIQIHCLQYSTNSLGSKQTTYVQSIVNDYYEIYIFNQ